MEQKTSRRKTAGKQESFRSLAAVSLILLMVTGLIFGASVLRRRAAGVLTNAKVSVSPRVAVVIDPGHGGFDGGAVGIDGSVEKEINLSLSLTLRDFLTVMGYAPKMTRETDISLDGNTDAPLRQRKREDLRARLSVMEEATDGKVLMIHQNPATAARRCFTENRPARKNWPGRSAAGSARRFSRRMNGNVSRRKETSGFWNNVPTRSYWSSVDFYPIRRNARACRMRHISGSLRL